jgi:hypothetical protein
MAVNLECHDEQSDIITRRSKGTDCPTSVCMCSYVVGDARDGKRAERASRASRAIQISSTATAKTPAILFTPNMTRACPHRRNAGVAVRYLATVEGTIGRGCLGWVVTWEHQTSNTAGKHS